MPGSASALSWRTRRSRWRWSGPNQVPGRAEQRRDDRRHHRRVQTVFRRHAGERREGDALRQHDDRADQAGERVGAQRVAVDPRPPAQEREQARNRGASALETVGTCLREVTLQIGPIIRLAAAGMQRAGSAAIMQRRIETTGRVNMKLFAHSRSRR